MSLPLILASASPRRRDLLTAWGVPHESIIADVDETLTPGMACASQAESLAVQKAQAIVQKLQAENRPGYWVLGADTLVSSAGIVLGKPRDDADATGMLQLLSGKIVEVATGVAVVDAEGFVSSGHTVTKLKMRAFSDDEIRTYVATKEPMGKAGAFAIQGFGGALIDSREGSYSNVVGLPKSLTIDLLKAAKFPEIPGA